MVGHAISILKRVCGFTQRAPRHHLRTFYSGINVTTFVFVFDGGGESLMSYVVKVKIALHKIKQTRRTLFKTTTIRERD